jgi:hypothetical protein
MSDEVNGVTDAKSEVEPLPVITDTKPEIKPLTVVPVNSSVSDSGFEDTLTGFGWFFLVVGILLGIFFIWKSGDITKKYSSIDGWGEHGYSWSLMIFGMFSIMQGLFLRLILEGIAEILRLLRRKK